MQNAKKSTNTMAMTRTILSWVIWYFHEFEEDGSEFPIIEDARLASHGPCDIENEHEALFLCEHKA